MERPPYSYLMIRVPTQKIVFLDPSGLPAKSINKPAADSSLASRKLMLRDKVRRYSSGLTCQAHMLTVLEYLIDHLDIEVVKEDLQLKVDGSAQTKHLLDVLFDLSAGKNDNKELDVQFFKALFKKVSLPRCLVVPHEYKRLLK